jgi:hypothetical protein
MARVRKVLHVMAFDYYKRSNGRFYPVPCIRLQGKWVARLGFEPGQKIEIVAKEGLVIVRPAKQE